VEVCFAYGSHVVLVGGVYGLVQLILVVTAELNGSASSMSHGPGSIYHRLAIISLGQL
jgi:hypothetical protein